MDGPQIDVETAEEAIEGLGRLALGLAGLACALVVTEMLYRLARRTGQRLAGRHPILAEIGWELRHRH